MIPTMPNTRGIFQKIELPFARLCAMNPIKRIKRTATTPIINPANSDQTMSEELNLKLGMSPYVGPEDRYSHPVHVAMSEHASAGNTVGSVKLPMSTSAVNIAPPSGTLYTAARPAPPPHATSSRFCVEVRSNQCDKTLPETPPISFGAASRPMLAPSPMTISERNEVRKLRRRESSPSPVQIASSISDFSFFKYLRIRNQPIAPIKPEARRTTTLCTPDVALAASL